MERDEREPKVPKKPTPSRAELRRRLKQEIDEALDDQTEDRSSEPRD